MTANATSRRSGRSLERESLEAWFGNQGTERTVRSLPVCELEPARLSVLDNDERFRFAEVVALFGLVDFGIVGLVVVRNFVGLDDLGRSFRDEGFGFRFGEPERETREDNRR